MYVVVDICRDYIVYGCDKIREKQKRILSD